MIRQNLISIFTLFPSWKNCIHHLILPYPADSWPRRPKQSGQQAHRAGNSEVQQQMVLCGWQSYQSLASASLGFAFIGLQILLGVSLLVWLFVCEPCRLPFQN